MDISMLSKSEQNLLTSIKIEVESFFKKNPNNDFFESDAYFSDIPHNQSLYQKIVSSVSECFSLTYLVYLTPISAHNFKIYVSTSTPFSIKGDYFKGVFVDEANAPRFAQSYNTHYSKKEISSFKPEFTLPDFFKHIK